MQSPIQLLCELISTPSVSRHEAQTAEIIARHLTDNNITAHRHHNNIWAVTPTFDPTKPILMLNSHHDTVPPAPSYKHDPYSPTITDGRLYGLGSNDAGASVVSLIETFIRLANCHLNYNLLLAITAEEEISGPNGMRALLPHLASLGYNPQMAIVGEPTGMNPAIGERGLVVLDCVAHGVTGHAARDEGVNALYIAIDDINRLRDMQFERVSRLLGPIHIAVTQIEAGNKHNVIPDECRFVADIRTTDAYTNTETVELIRQQVQSEISPRSLHISASVIDRAHPMVQSAIALGGVPFISPTTSDMALMPDIATLKIGPGDSSRSHTADEFVFINQIDDAIERYTQIIKQL